MQASMVARLHGPAGMWRGRVGSALITAMAIALSFACGDALKQDELDCEEAVSYLEGCCPNFDDTTIQCVDQQSCDTSILPDISEEESACIRGESCEQLVATGVCTRVLTTRGRSCP